MDRPDAESFEDRPAAYPPASTIGLERLPEGTAEKAGMVIAIREAALTPNPKDILFRQGLLASGLNDFVRTKQPDQVARLVDRCRLQTGAPKLS